MKTQKYIMCLLLWLIVSHMVIGQVDGDHYGDEWIVDDQTYFKFSVNEDGIYRIPLAVLQTAGVPISQILGKQYSIFSYGKEVPLRTTTNAVFGENDFIEFYATHNDGTIDALLYDDPANQQLNPYISLYSDSRPYYLTWSDDDSPKRFVEKSNGLDADGLPPKEPYYIHREIKTFDEFHHKPTHDGRNFIRYSSMDNGEGYGGPLYGSQTLEMKVDRLSSFGVDPRVIMRFGTNVNSRTWKVTTDQRNLKISGQSGYGVVDIDERFPLDELHEGLYNINIDPLNDDNGRHTLARIELHYPRRYEFDGETQIRFQQQASIISRYIELNGFGGSQPILYNLTDNSYVIPDLLLRETEGNQVRFVTGSAFQENSWILVDQAQSIRAVNMLTEITFETPEMESEYMIISHADLISSGAIQSYADYRSSEEGGGYNTKIININDLIERYAYGIKGHPLAIKNLMRSLREKEMLPDYTFIIGKGREYTEIKEGKATTALVPTFGIPGSDNLFMAFDGLRHPQRPIGRLAAQNPQEVLNYLEKIKTHEIGDQGQQTKEDQSWKKDILHLSGGSASNQATLFRFLNDMSDVITSNTFGANVSTFRKISADPLERVTTEEIVSEIDKGVALITFFGHSAVGTFDFSLEHPERYNNTGRNPIILSLGCHSGNIHTSVSGISEDFVLEKGNGAIAFIASSGTAFPEPQYFTGINFYDRMGDEMYGQPIGDILQKSLEERTHNPSLSVQTLIEQLTLHGDPAYRYGSFQGPDYNIDQQSVSILPTILNATTSTFTLSFDVLNLGAVIDDVLDIQIIHILPDGSPVDTQMVAIPAPSNSSNVTIDLNNPGESWIGSNRLLISVDPQSQITEYPTEGGEKNNNLIGDDGKIGTPFFVFDNSAKPVFPEEYGILSEAPIVLRSAVNNGLNPGGQFVMQIDTTEGFNSPLFTEQVRNNNTSIIDWTPDLPALEGVVYYWRIAPINAEGREKSNSWQSSSFIYLENSPPGWNQSHLYQWQDNDYHKLKLDANTQIFEYTDRLWDIRIKNEIRDEGDFWVFVNNTAWASLNPNGMGTLLSIFAWDHQEVIFENSGSDFGSIPFSSDGFLFDMQGPEDVSNVMALLEAIPDGARVFFHTMIDNDFTSLNVASWADKNSNNLSLVDVLEAEGAVHIAKLVERGTVPYTFIYDKSQGAIVEDIANNIYETVDLTSMARTIWSEGTTTSVPLKAQDRWLRLMWSEEKEEGDQTRLLVLGIKQNGQRDTLKWVIDDYDINLTSIDPERYPEIELVYQTEDNINKTASQLSYWRVLTNSLPDAAFYTKTSSFEIVDTLNAGERLPLDFDLVNLTDVDMGPVLIKYTLIDQTFKENIVIKRSLPLAGKDTINVIVDIPTEQLAGDYQVVIEVNPNGDQKEVTECNNLGYTNFYVRPDHRNPFLDVTFDGRHIIDKEKIISTPEIIVSLRDEDSFVLLDDPKDFDITLFYPQGQKWKVDSSSAAVVWIPSTSLEDNKASLIIRPDLDQEGIYTLVVQAKDIAGNLAGDQTYRVTFEVDLGEDIPRLTVSPNPMTTFSEFSYYLDSDVEPPVFDLYIYSADGRMVKHATKADFGGIKQGLNKYRWDGLSENGNELPTALYFYEIVNSFDSRKEKRKGSVFKL